MSDTPKSSSSIKYIDLLMLIIGSQIGSGCFVMPAQMNPCGLWSVVGILCTGGAILCFAFILNELEAVRIQQKDKGTDLVYKNMCESSAPASYIGQHMGFFLGKTAAWFYWFVAWFSSIPLLTLAILSIFGMFNLTDWMSQQTPLFVNVVSWLMSVFIITGLSAINCRGFHNVAVFERWLNFFKAFCFVLMPIALLFYGFFMNPGVLQWHYWTWTGTSGALLDWKHIIKASAVAIWGFIGVETIVSYRESVENPTKVIPKTLVVGTLIVTLIYLLNNITFLAMIGNASQLTDAYGSLLNTLFYTKYTLQIMATLTSFVILSTLNAWIISVAQLSHQSARAGFFPKFFENNEDNSKPSFWSVFIPSSGMLLILPFVMGQSLKHVINNVIEMSTLLFVWIYLFCVCALCIFYVKQSYKHDYSISIGMKLSCLVCFCFFLIVLADAGLSYNLQVIALPLFFLVCEYIGNIYYKK